MGATGVIDNPSAGGGAIVPATLVVGASDSLDSLRADYQCGGDADQVTIETALGDLPAGGGMIVLLEGTYILTGDIDVPDDDITIAGMGKATIIKVKDNHNTDINCFHLASRDRCVIRDLVLDGNDGNQTGGDQNGIKDETGGAYNMYENLIVHDFRDYGIEINGGSYSEIKSCSFYDNTDRSVTIQNGSTHIRVHDCQSLSDTNYGFHVDDSPYCVISSCIVDAAGTGIFIQSGTTHHCSVIGSIIKDCTSRGILIQESYAVVSGCQFEGNAESLEIADGGQIIADCVFYGGDVDVNAGDNIIIGCSFYDTSELRIDSDDNAVLGCFFDSDSLCVVNKSNVVNIGKSNVGLSCAQLSEIIYAKNTTGGVLSAGSVLVYKDVAAGDEIETTTTASDDKVAGILIKNTSIGAYGPVVQWGYVVDAKVDGTIDIAVGDLLTTFTVAGVMRKCATGEIAIARALEVYTNDDSNGTIDVMVIQPRTMQ